MTKLLGPLKTIIVSCFTYFMFGKWRIEDVFDIWYAAHERSPTIRKIFREVYGDDYLEEVDQSSFVTGTDLQRMIQHLSIGKGSTLVDLACGRGGPGLWVARQTGANLIGTDISEVAVNAARRRIADFGLEQEVRFQVGSFEETGLPDASVDAAMSVDALFLSLDKEAAVEEIKRILRPGGRFVFTSWEGTALAMVRDHRRLLQRKGLEVELCEETKDWRQRQAAVYKSIVAEKDALIGEMGHGAANVWIKDAANIKHLHRLRRVLVVARKAA